MALPFLNVGLAPSPGIPTKKPGPVEDAPWIVARYSDLGPITFYDRAQGQVVDRPLAGKLVYDQNGKVVVGNVRSHEVLGSMFDMDLHQGRLFGYLEPNVVLKIWYGRADFAGRQLETPALVQVLLKHGVLQPASRVEMSDDERQVFTSTVQDLLGGAEGQAKGGQDEREREAQALAAASRAGKAQTLYAQRGAHPKDWFYRYPESQVLPTFRRWLDQRVQAI
jgi:hypothetical protein